MVKTLDKVEGTLPQARSIAQKVYNTVHCLKLGQDGQDADQLYYLPEWRSQKQTTFCSYKTDDDLTTRFNSKAKAHVEKEEKKVPKPSLA